MTAVLEAWAATARSLRVMEATARRIPAAARGEVFSSGGIWGRFRGDTSRFCGEKKTSLPASGPAYFSLWAEFVNELILGFISACGCICIQPAKSPNAFKTACKYASVNRLVSGSHKNTYCTHEGRKFTPSRGLPRHAQIRDGAGLMSLLN